MARPTWAPKTSRPRAILQARQTLAAKPIYLDTETTGLGLEDEIIEICLLDHDGSSLLESLVRPTRLIAPEATRIHGLSFGMVSRAPTWKEIWPQVEAAVTGRTVAIYNAEFDLRLMQQSHRAHRMTWNPLNADPICLLELYAEFYGEWDSRLGSYRRHNLEVAASRMRIPLRNVHRAKDDALLARAVLQAIASQQP